MLQNKFKVKLSKEAKLMTSISLILISFAIGVCAFAMIDQPKTIYVMSGICIILIFTVSFCYLLSPRYIEISNDMLIMHKVIGTLSIPIKDIKEIRPYHKSGIRLFGSGGMYGYLGLFSNTEIGKHYEWVGDFEDGFLIVMYTGKKYLLSCEQSDIVISKVKENKAKLTSLSSR